MKVSKRVEYGVRAMVLLAKNKGKKAFSVREISNIEHVPYEFLAKIFADLERAKLVLARHGANGGYYLAKPASKITPGSIIKVLEESISTTHCADCPKAENCSSKEIWQKVQKSLDKALNAKTLAQLIK